MMKLAPGLSVAIVAMAAVWFYLTNGKARRTTDTALTRIELKVTAHEWWWEFDEPELGVKAANELHIPEK